MQPSTDDAALQAAVMELAIGQLTHDERLRYRIVLLRDWLELDDGSHPWKRAQREEDLQRTQNLVGLLDAHDRGEARELSADDRSLLRSALKRRQAC